MSAPPVDRTFAVDGMHCASCAMSIDWELEDVDGVIEAKTSYAKARTDVRYDPGKVSEADLVAAIERAGYSVRAGG